MTFFAVTPPNARGGRGTRTKSLGHRLHPLTDGQAAPALGAELRGMFSVATENRNIPHAMARSDSDASDAWDDCAELGEMDSTM